MPLTCALCRTLQSQVVLPTEIKEKLRQIVNYSKAQAVLFGQWGFQQQHGRAQGISAVRTRKGSLTPG